MPLGIDFAQIFLHFFNVAILFIGLYILLYSPVKKFMDAREQKYKDMDSEAEAKRKDAENVKAEYEEKLKEADAEIVAQKKAAASEIEDMRVERMKDAEKAADKILADARFQAAEQKRKIIDDARQDIVGMLEEATKKVVQEGTVSDSYDVFLDEAERSIESGK